jgi:uncharacterized damage-inducible protein DinB
MQNAYNLNINISMKKTATILLAALLSLGAYNSDAYKTNTNQPKNKTMTATTKPTELTQQERDSAIKFLRETESGVFDAVKGLSEAQLKFKSAANKWSTEECVKHIASSEKVLWAVVEETLKQPANPDKRAELKFNDQDLIKAVEDRSHKSTTFAELEPANSSYQTTAEALASFKENREKLIAFVKNTKDDLRNHVSVSKFGTYDTYQFILLISAHSNRHTQQIEEVKGDVNFPKS